MPATLGLESQVSLGGEVSGDKRRGWLPPTWAQSPGASLEGLSLLLYLEKGQGTVLPSQPETKVHGIPHPPVNCSPFADYMGELNREGAQKLCSRPHYWQEFPQDPPYPSRSQVRYTLGLLPWARGSNLKAPTIHRRRCPGSRPHCPAGCPCVCVCVCNMAPNGSLLRSPPPQHHPGLQPLCKLPPTPWAWPRGSMMPGWAGVGPRGRSRLTQSYRKKQCRRGRRGENRQLPACLGWGWLPGWGLGLGEDMTAKPGSYRESSD